jgi:class III poly(R)-hydroxyalkanoic acid synthase PhaE subunit
MAGVAPAVPDLQAVQASQAGFEQAWSAAQAVSRAFAGGLDGSKAGKSDPVAADVLAKIFDPSGWLTATNPLDENLTRMAEGPRLADLWNIERRFGSVFTAWTALRRRNLEHGTVMLEAWTKATGEFSKVVNERAQAGKPLDSPREMMALWVEIANDVLLETQRSEAFLKSQRETLKASTDLRLAQQELAEFYAEMFGYPTRAELDDVHRSLTELRREVRSPARTAARAKPSGKKAKVASR